MGKILSLSNQKGGTSKSSSAVNLGAALKMKGKKVLIVDLDPQGDASTYPPYLTRREMDELQREVRYEPETALFGGDDGLDFYRRLIPLWSGRLEKNGVLAFEVGNGQAEAVKSLLENEALRTEILPDFQGIGRVVFGRKM